MTIKKLLFSPAGLIMNEEGELEAIEIPPTVVYGPSSNSNTPTTVEYGPSSFTNTPTTEYEPSSFDNTP